MESRLCRSAYDTRLCQSLLLVIEEATVDADASQEVAKTIRMELWVISWPTVERGGWGVTLNLLVCIEGIALYSVHATNDVSTEICYPLKWEVQRRRNPYFSIVVLSAYRLWFWTWQIRLPLKRRRGMSLFHPRRQIQRHWRSWFRCRPRNNNRQHHSRNKNTMCNRMKIFPFSWENGVSRPWKWIYTNRIIEIQV